MKKLILFSILAAVFTYNASAQYRAYHKEDLTNYKKKKVKSFQMHVSPYSYGLRGKYKPQKFQGLQVISMNRPEGTHDDVYFIDKNGIHNIKPSSQLRRSICNKITEESMIAPILQVIAISPLVKLYSMGWLLYYPV